MDLGLNSAVKTIRVYTAYGPPIEIDDPFAPGPPNAAIAWMKPRVEITFAVGNPLVIQPWGDPRPGHWGEVQVGGIVAGALAYFGAMYLLLRGRR